MGGSPPIEGLSDHNRSAISGRFISNAAQPATRGPASPRRAGNKAAGARSQ